MVSFLPKKLQYFFQNVYFPDPGPVENLTFTNSYYLLRWSKPLNYNNCTLQAYVISVKDVNEEFQVYTDPQSTSYNFDFLDLCSTYMFVVRVLTYQHLLGPSQVLNVTTVPTNSMFLIFWQFLRYFVSVGSETESIEFRELIGF